MTQEAELRSMLLTVLKKLEADGKRIKTLEDAVDNINKGILKLNNHLDRLEANIIQLKMSQNKDRSVTVHIPS